MIYDIIILFLLIILFYITNNLKKYTGQNQYKLEPFNSDNDQIISNNNISTNESQQNDYNPYLIEDLSTVLYKYTKPYIFNPGKKIAIVLLYTPNIYSYVSINLINLSNYVIKNDYTLIIYSNLISFSVFPCWNKILAVLENLKNHDYLMWLDADAIICNHGIKIENIIKDNSNIDLFLCNDIKEEYECINSGVMIIKNTDWSYKLFEKTWYNPIEHHHNDQNVLFYEIVKDTKPEVESELSLKFNKFCKKDIHPKIKIFDQNKFNSNIYCYLTNDFIIHLMGVSEHSRINIMRQINTRLGFDNHDDKVCLEILSYLGNNSDSDIKRSIIGKFCLDEK